MKTLIYQYYRDAAKSTDGPAITVGYEYWKHSRKTIQKYAHDVSGSDYKFLDHDIGMSPFYGIFVPLIEGWADDYDAICFIDSDILATKNSKSVFNYSNEDCISFNQMGVKACHPWLRERGGHGNTGTVIIPRQMYKPLLNYFENNVGKLQNEIHMGGWDQQLINMFVVSQQKFNPLPNEFNWHMTRYDQTKRWEQSLIHYHRENKKMMSDEFNDNRILK